MAELREKKIDVIIPCYRPGPYFLRQLELLGRQSLPLHRLIIVNTEEKLMSPEAGAAAEAFGERLTLRHIRKEDFDHGGTRNLGAALSDGDAMLFLTDDAEPADEYLLERLAEALYRAPGPDGLVCASVYGRQLAREDASEEERHSRLFNYPPESCEKSLKDLQRLGIKTYFSSNACCMYDREIFLRLGAFEKEAVFNEDMLFAAKALKAGYKIAYEAEARVLHSHAFSCMQQFRRNFDLGMSQAMHPEVFRGIPSEGEGIRMVRQTAARLASKGKFLQLPVLFVRSAFKYAGYRLGRAYRLLPLSVIRSCSANKAFIDRYFGRKGKSR